MWQERRRGPPSVLISFLKEQPGEITALFRDVLVRDVPFGFSAFTYQEVLQGRDESLLCS